MKNISRILVTRVEIESGADGLTIILLKHLDKSWSWAYPNEAPSLPHKTREAALDAAKDANRAYPGPRTRYPRGWEYA